MSTKFRGNVQRRQRISHKNLMKKLSLIIIKLTHDIEFEAGLLYGFVLGAREGHLGVLGAAREVAPVILCGGGECQLRHRNVLILGYLKQI